MFVDLECRQNSKFEALISVFMKIEEQTTEIEKSIDFMSESKMIRW